MATLREWLNELGFDWENGIIVYQPVTEDAWCPGWAGDDEFLPPRIIPRNHPILDEEFDNGYGAPECPRIVAEDKERVYFPVQHDGATWLVYVYKDVRKYVEKSEETPYPGG